MIKYSMFLFLSNLTLTFIFTFISLKKYISLNINVQKIRDLGIDSHSIKNNIPTAGGIFFLIPILVYSLFYNLDLFILTSFFFLLGIYDDSLKIEKNMNDSAPSANAFQTILGFFKNIVSVEHKYNNGGLNVSGKFILQCLFAFVWSVFILDKTNLYFPLFDISNIYLKNIILSCYYSLVIVSAVNAFNMTDGLDGLLTLIFLPILFLFAYSAFVWILIISLLTFLIFNYNPAKVFMGDTGSLSLGAICSYLFITNNLTLWMPILCLIPVIEVLSVILQVFWLRKYNKRLFRMSPIHHHFEHLGYSEKQIVIGAFIIQISICLLYVLI